MMPFSGGELDGLRATQEGSMLDTCELLGYVAGGRDDHNLPTPGAWDLVATSRCGFDPGAGDEVLEAAEVATSEASLRLPYSAASSLDRLSRVRVTHRYGQELGSPQLFEVVGLPEVGPTGLVVNLRRVTTGEA